MNSEEALATIGRIGVLPVVALTDAALARPLAEALAAGGLGCVEITLRTPAGLAAIAEAASLPGFVVAAGTVLGAEQAAACVDAGADVIVSPGLDEEVVAEVRRFGAMPVPGVATATEVQRALRLGLDQLKLFPAGPLGGPMVLDALAGPFAGVRFIPSGGVTSNEAFEYARRSNVLAVSGSWMVPPDAVAAADWSRVTDLAAQAVAAVAR